MFVLEQEEYMREGIVWVNKIKKTNKKKNRINK